jgi:hypothetical protein
MKNDATQYKESMLKHIDHKAIPIIQRKYYSNKLSTLKIVIVTSLFWILIDGIVLYNLISESNRNDSYKSGSNLKDDIKFNNKSVKINSGIARKEEKILFDFTKVNLKLANFIPRIFSRVKNKTVSFEKPKKKVFSKKKENLRASTKTKAKEKKSTKKWIVEGLFNQATNPPSWPGENGKAVILPENLKKESARRYKENQFDIVVSDSIAINRTVGERRHPKYFN